MWDTAGQRIFRNSMAGLTSRDAFVMLVYDVTVRPSSSYHVQCMLLLLLLLLLCCCCGGC